MLHRGADSRRDRATIRQACQDDLFFFADTFVWQLNPKHINREVGPWLTWDFQRGALRRTMDRLFAEYPDDMLWEKSRDMGATWMALILSFWLCNFHEHKRVLCVSHSEKAVDKSGDEGTLFAKLGFILDYLPEWLVPGVERMKLNFVFPGRSTISGDSSTGRSGVGDRVSMVLLDEFSKQRDGYEIWGQTADTGPRLVIGTHYGIGTCYFDLTQRPDMRKEVLHWSEHPEKRKGLYRYNDDTNQVEHLDTQYEHPPDFKFVMDAAPRGGPYPGIRSPWYDRECVRRRSERDVAMHLDINPSGSMSQVFDPVMVRRHIKVHSRDPYWRGDVRIDKDLGKLLEFVPARHGMLKLWCLLNDSGLPPAGHYAMGADLATGGGATPSCLTITNCKTGEKVAEYTDARTAPKEMAPIATALCWAFQSIEGSPAKMAWEIPGPGVSFGARVIELGFRHFYCRTFEAPHTMTRETSDRPGWVNNSPEVLRELLTDYMAALTEGLMVNRSEDAMLECLAFRWNASGDMEHAEIAKKNDPAGARRNHADHVIADALSWKMVKDSRMLVNVSGKKVEDPFPFMSIGWLREQAENMERDAERWGD